MNSNFKWISRSIPLIFSYFLASAPNQKLLFLENVFTDNIHKVIFDNSWLIIIILLLTYIIFEAIVHFRNRSKLLEKQCQNICRYIYSKIEEDMGESFSNCCRVTIFKAVRTFFSGDYLKAISRFQKKAPYINTKIKFIPEIGVVGLCYATNTLIIENKMPDFEKSPKSYYSYSFKNYNMDEDTVNKLNTKSRFFLGIPIKCFDTERTWGILLIDATEKVDNLSRSFARNFEDIIKHYSTIFIEGEK